MEFPSYQVPYAGNPTVIALTAIVHVLISHGLAIGAMAIIVLSEAIAWRRGSDPWRTFAKDLTKFVVVVITGVGAVTGVGIWLTTSALAPRGIGSMLRVFFWPWMFEWFAFIAELIVLVAYYFLWDRWETRHKKAHLMLGIVYVVLSCVSAALITAILGFMLTPGDWPAEHRFWDAFFNPSYIPQLLIRLSASALLGALIALAAVLLYHKETSLANDALPVFGAVAVTSMMVLGGSLWWHFARLPADFRDQSIGAVLTSHLSQTPNVFWIGNAIGLLLLVLVCGFALARRVRPTRWLVVPALLAAFAFVGEFERIREFIRAPYLMPGYMYANGVLLQERPFFDERGMLAGSGHTQADPDRAAAYLFARNCSACHTIGGVNDIRTRLAGRSQDGIYVILGHAHKMIPFMPPFSGNDDERRLLASFLHRLEQGEIVMASHSRFIPAPAAPRKP